MGGIGVGLQVGVGGVGVSTTLAVLLIPGRVGDLEVYSLYVQLDRAALCEAPVAVLALVALLTRVDLLDIVIIDCTVLQGSFGT